MKLELLLTTGMKMLVDCDSFRVCDPNEPEPEVVQMLPEGEMFEVNYKKIDQNLFKKKRDNKSQERLRKIIRKALAKAKWHPEKYAEPFYTLIPKLEWNEKKSVQELKEYAQHLGGYMADGVEQALQWAQLISNGENWETLCNEIDTAKCYRLINWKNGEYRLIGGSTLCEDNVTPTFFINQHIVDTNSYDCVVPLVVIKK